MMSQQVRIIPLLCQLYLTLFHSFPFHFYIGISSTLLTKATNPKSSIVKHPSYRGVITGKEAEACLFRQEGKCYLVRYSGNLSCYVLSVKFIDGLEKVYNFKVVDGEKLWVDCNERAVEFHTLQELLMYYTDNPLTYGADSTIGSMYQL